MFKSPTDSWDRVRQTFAEQFEQDGNNLVYRRSQKGVAIRVSVDERTKFIGEFDRNILRAKWIIYIGLALVLGGVILLSLARGSDLSQVTIFAAIGLAMTPYFAYYRWAWAAPARELAGRTPIAGERSSEEVRRLRFQRITYGQLAGAAFGGLLIPFIGSSYQDVFSGWNRLWLIFGGALVLLAAVQAFRKWRIEQEDSYKTVIPRPSSRDTTERTQGTSSRTQGQFWRYLPFAVMLLALAFIVLTPAGKRLALTPSFWPIIIIGFGCWSLFTVAQGFTKGQIEPFTRGFYNTFQRETQPKRFWASMGWNALFGCLGLWVAYQLIIDGPIQALRDRCFDAKGAYYPQEQLSACNQLIKRPRGGHPEMADLVAARGSTYFRLHDYAHARIDYANAARLDPTDSTSRYNLGLVDERFANKDNAIADYSAAIRIDPEDADAYLNRGLIYLDGGKLDQALTDFGRAHELKPKDPWPLANRGIAYAWAKDQRRAEQDFSAVRLLDPSNPVMLRGEALLAVNAGDLQAAVEKLTAALKSEPYNVWALRARATAYERLGKQAEADSDRDALWRIGNNPNNAGR